MRMKLQYCKQRNGVFKDELRICFLVNKSNGRGKEQVDWHAGINELV